MCLINKRWHLHLKGIEIEKKQFLFLHKNFKLLEKLFIDRLSGTCNNRIKSTIINNEFDALYNFNKKIFLCVTTATVNIGMHLYACQPLLI